MTPEGAAPRPEVSVTVAASFSAAHRLHREDRSEEWKAEVYGPCARAGGHGHEYLLETTVAGPVDPRSGFAIDARELAAVVERAVVAPCRLRHLNRDVPFLSGLNPTAENLAVAFAGEIGRALPAGSLRSIVLRETPRNTATWIAPGEGR